MKKLLKVSVIAIVFITLLYSLIASSDKTRTISVYEIDSNGNQHYVETIIKKIDDKVMLLNITKYSIDSTQALVLINEDTGEAVTIFIVYPEHPTYVDDPFHPDNPQVNEE